MEIEDRLVVVRGLEDVGETAFIEKKNSGTAEILTLKNKVSSILKKNPNINPKLFKFLIS